VYYYTSGTLNGLHGTIGTVNGTVNGLYGTIGTVNGLHGTIGTENGALNGLHGTSQMEKGWDALTANSKFTLWKLSLFITVIITICISIYKH
jgi:hypothetical protein